MSVRLGLQWVELHYVKAELTRGPQLAAPRHRCSGPLRLGVFNMRSLEDFFRERNPRSWRGPTVASAQRKPLSGLYPEVRAAANRGLQVFPVSDYARVSRQPNLLIAEASCDIARLEEMAAEYRTWRIAIGPSGLCVLRTDGPVGRSSLASLIEDQGDCSTLIARRAETTWAFFHWPTGMALRAEARKLRPGVSVLGDGESCPIGPSDDCVWVNPWAEIEAVPNWLLELAFEPLSPPPGRALPLPARSNRTRPCRSNSQPANPNCGTRKGYAMRDQAGFRSGYGMCRRR